MRKQSAASRKRSKSIKRGECVVVIYVIYRNISICQYNVFCWRRRDDVSAGCVMEYGGLWPSWPSCVDTLKGAFGCRFRETWRGGGEGNSLAELDAWEPRPPQRFRGICLLNDARRSIIRVSSLQAAGGVANGGLFRQVELMATPVKCAKGHWYQPDPTGKVVGCPRCLAAADPRTQRRISDDDVLAILSGSDEGDAASASTDSTKSLPKLHKCSLKRHKKVCPACHCETSFAFEYCPRCAGPLEVAVIDVS